MILLGSANGMAKLREAEVFSQYTQAEIAEMFGVGRECVSYHQAPEKLEMAN